MRSFVLKDFVETILLLHLLTSACAFPLYNTVFSHSRSCLLVRQCKRLTLASSHYSLPKDIDLGPPHPMKQLEINQPSLKAFRINNDSVRTNFTIHRVAYDPDIYVLKNYLSRPECDSIMQTAIANTMSPAETVTTNDYQSRTFCNVTWIPSSGPDKLNLVANVMSSTANLLLSKDILHHPSAGVEDLQVLKYGKGGEFVLHHDGEPRVVTVIYYLNGVAGTWFPLARTSQTMELLDQYPIEQRNEMERQFEKIRKDPQNKQQALDFGKDFAPGKNGLLVKSRSNRNEQSDEHTVIVEAGDAVAFYNYRNDESLRLDWRSLHTGLPTDAEEKWIANHWFRVNDLSSL